MPKLLNRFFNQAAKILPFLLLPPLALADGDTPVSQGLGYITTSLFGSTGLIIATIAIMGVGLACLFHFLEWKRLLQTIGGIAILFGAGGIVAAIKALITT